MDEKKINLIKKAISNNKDAIIQLIKEEQNSIYTTLYYLKKDGNEIADIMQDILIKICKKIPHLKNPKYFKSWLNQIILNSYYDYLRKNKKKESLYSIEETPVEIADYESNPQEKLLNSELNSIIKHSIQNLPAHYKIPIALREIQGLSYDEISNLTKTTIGTVKSRIARARNLIKQDITKYAKG